MTDWLVCVANVPCPAMPELDGPGARRFARLQATWEQHVAPFVPAGGDFEDWTEQACRLQAGLDEFGPNHTWLRVHGRPVVHAVTGEQLPDVEADNLPRWGVQHQCSAARTCSYVPP